MIFDSFECAIQAPSVKLAVDLVKQESGKFEPEKMQNEYCSRGL